MSIREIAYAALAISGLVAPWYFNVAYMTHAGSLSDVGGAMKLAFANPISSSFSADLLIAFVTFAVWVTVEARRLGMPRGWLYALLGLLISFAFAFPLFLLRREQYLRRVGK